MSRLPLEYSHYPCGYGGGGLARHRWGQVSTGGRSDRDLGADTVTSLSLLALLSQALVGFTAAYESRVPFAMLVGMYLDAAFADGSAPLADAPSVLMIAGNGKSSLERHGVVEVDESKQVTLSLGRKFRDVYRPTVAAVESSLQRGDAPDRTGDARRSPRGHADHPDVRYVGGHAGFAEVSARL